MAKPDFSKLLNQQLAKAAGGMKSRADEKHVPQLAAPSPSAASPPNELAPGTSGSATVSPISPSAVPEPPGPPIASENLIAAAKATAVDPAPTAASAGTSPQPQPPARASNLNRVTVNLFDADRRALAVIKEKLASYGHDFTNRSDSIKIGLRLAAKASSAELSAIIQEVRSEDRRFSNKEPST